MKIHPKGFDLSLDRVTGLLDRLGNPQGRMPPVIHVAGTNGKGSTIAFCRAILESAGLSVHVHTSPHLVDWAERYRIGKPGGGALVDDDTLAEAIDRVADANGGQPITVFEVLTVVMFLLFSEHPADVALVEVGLGGRFDATNVMEETAVSVITPISMDHEAYLGDTLAKIAFEKAGIIKPGGRVVVAQQEEEARDVIARQAARQRATAVFAGEDFNGSEEDGRLVFRDDNGLLDLPLPRLAGRHQKENATTAIAACRVLAEQLGKTIAEEAFEQGISGALWAGRMQRLTTGSLVEKAGMSAEIWLDGGHNPGAAAAIADWLRGEAKREDKGTALVCGMLTTKDPRGYFRALADLVGECITVPVRSSDAGFDAEELASIARECGIAARSTDDLMQAVGMAAEGGNSRILIAGSLYLVGDALALNGTPPD